MTGIITNNETKCTIAMAALEQVIDPEIGLNVVDLGLIYQVDFDDAAKKIYVNMTLTTQFCPMGAVIVDAVRQALQAVFAGDVIDVSLIFSPPWNHNRISEEGKNYLNR